MSAIIWSAGPVATTGTRAQRATCMRASAAKRAGASVSGRAPGSTPAAAIAAASSSAAQRVPQRLAALREGGRDHAGEGRPVAQRRRAVRASGCSAKNVDTHRGGGEKAPVPMSNSGVDPHVRRQHHRQAAVRRRAGRAAMRATTSFCSMKCMSAIASICAIEAEQQRRRDVVGQVADQPQARAVAAQRAQVELAARRRGAPSSSPRPAQRASVRGTTSRSISITSSAPAAVEQRRGDRAAAGTDLRRAVDRAAARSRARCGRSCPGRAGSAARSASWRRVQVRGRPRPAASGKLDGERRRPRAGCPGPRIARAGEVERGAVVDRGAHDRQAERHVDGVAEARVLQHRQALVVIHREHGVAVRELRAGRKAVSAGTGPREPQPGAAQAARAPARSPRSPRGPGARPRRRAD